MRITHTVHNKHILLKHIVHFNYVSDVCTVYVCMYLYVYVYVCMGDSSSHREEFLGCEHFRMILQHHECLVFK